MKLEVIAKNLRDVIKINQTKADRIEFCQNLEEGGLTPVRWMIKLATKISKVPINVMLRPSSRSFNYSEKEFAQMLNDAAWLETTKVNGVVFGILNDKNEIDVERMKQIIAKLPNKQKTFHKAFDEVSDFQNALAILNDLRIDSVLTAAGKDINQNLAVLQELTKNNKVTIIAGGGVTFSNVSTIKGVVDEIHVGTAIRQKTNWKSKIDVSKVNQLYELINNK